MMSSLWFPDIGDKNAQTELLLPFMRIEAVVVVVVLSVYLVIKYTKNSDETVNQKIDRSPVNRFLTKRKITTSTISRVTHFGSLRLPYIDGIYSFHKLHKVGVRVLEEWASNFGRVFEIPLGVITVFGTSEVAVVQKLLMSTSPDHLNKPAHIYDKIFVDCMKDGLVNSEYSTWSRRRKMLSRAFTYKSLQSYLKIMNLHSRNLVTSLTEQCSPVNDNRAVAIEGDRVWDLLYFHAIKIICMVIMGADRVSREETNDFYHTFAAFKHAVLDRLLNIELHIPPYWYFHPKKKIYDQLSHDCDLFFGKIIQMYRQEYEDSKRRSLEDTIDTNKDENGRKGMSKAQSNDNEDTNDVGEKPSRCLVQEMLNAEATDEECYSEVGTFLTAGHETTVTALQFLLVNLALNPLEQDKCKEEIDLLMASKGANRNTDNENVHLDMDDLSSLKHLERCIMESGRITPTIPMFLRRLDAPLKIDDDLELRRGGTVAVLTWMLHRDPENFPDPEKFDSNRFLPENVKKRHPHSYIPFSSGQRNCIGWKMALMEMKVMMSWILFHFDVYTTDKLDDVKLHFEVTLLPERNYNVILTKRK